MQMPRSVIPVTGDAFQTLLANDDFWFGLLSQGAEDLVYGSFPGGAQSAEHVDGGTSRFDKTEQFTKKNSLALLVVVAVTSPLRELELDK